MRQWRISDATSPFTSAFSTQHSALAGAPSRRLSVFHRSRRFVHLGCERGVLCRDAARNDGAWRLRQSDVQLRAARQQARVELLDRCWLLSPVWRVGWRAARPDRAWRDGVDRHGVLSRSSGGASRARGGRGMVVRARACRVAAAADVRPSHLHRHLHFDVHGADAPVFCALGAVSRRDAVCI